MSAQMRLLRRNSRSLRKDDFGFVFLFHKFDLVFFVSSFPSFSLFRCVHDLFLPGTVNFVVFGL